MSIQKKYWVYFFLTVFIFLKNLYFLSIFQAKNFLNFLLLYKLLTEFIDYFEDCVQIIIILLIKIIIIVTENIYFIFIK